MTSFFSRTKAAAQIAAKQAERTKISKLDLPRIFTAMGRQVYSAGTHRDEFSGLHQRIDKLIQQIQAIQATAAGRPAAQGLAERAKALASRATEAMQLKGLHRTICRLQRKLGIDAYEAHREASGPPDMIGQIKVCQERIGTLDSEIAALNSVPHGTVVTPKRIAVAGAILASVWLIGLVGHFLFPRQTSISASAGAGASTVKQDYTSAGAEHVTARGVTKSAPLLSDYLDSAELNAMKRRVEQPKGTGIEFQRITMLSGSLADWGTYYLSGRQYKKVTFSALNPNQVFGVAILDENGNAKVQVYFGNNGKASSYEELLRPDECKVGYWPSGNVELVQHGDSKVRYYDNGTKAAEYRDDPCDDNPNNRFWSEDGQPTDQNTYCTIIWGPEWRGMYRERVQTAIKRNAQQIRDNYNKLKKQGQ